MIEMARDIDPGEWDAFVTGHTEARFSHLWGYRCVEASYGYRATYLGFRQQGRLVGVLPAFDARSLLFGRRLLSQPFSEYGGLLIDPSLSDDDRRSIKESVRTVMVAEGFKTLETHGNYGWGSDPLGPMTNAQELAVLDLRRSIDELWSKVISRHVRKAITKAEREGVTVEEGSDPETLRTVFYPLYLRSMKRLGSPPHSLDYFLRCRESLDMRIFWASFENRMISGLLGFTCGNRVSITNIVSDERYWSLRPNDLVHWAYIKWAHAQGCQSFDFGSVRYDGQSQFKRKWGCDLRDSGYFVLEASPGTGRRHTFDSSSRIATDFAKVWALCVPTRVTALVGPTVRKQLMR